MNGPHDEITASHQAVSKSDDVSRREPTDDEHGRCSDRSNASDRSNVLPVHPGWATVSEDDYAAADSGGWGAAAAPMTGPLRLPGLTKKD